MKTSTHLTNIPHLQVWPWPGTKTVLHIALLGCTFEQSLKIPIYRRSKTDIRDKVYKHLPLVTGTDGIFPPRGGGGCYCLEPVSTLTYRHNRQKPQTTSVSYLGNNWWYVPSLGTPWATSVSLYYGVSGESRVLLIGTNSCREIPVQPLIIYCVYLFNNALISNKIF